MHENNYIARVTHRSGIVIDDFGMDDAGVVAGLPPVPFIFDRSSEITNTSNETSRGHEELGEAVCSSRIAINYEVCIGSGEDIQINMIKTPGQRSQYRGDGLCFIE